MHIYIYIICKYLGLSICAIFVHVCRNVQIFKKLYEITYLCIRRSQAQIKCILHTHVIENVYLAEAAEIERQITKRALAV